MKLEDYEQQADALAHIIQYEDRIEDAREKLKALPIDAPDWKARKKLEGKRKALNDHIRHNRSLIQIAEESLK